MRGGHTGSGQEGDLVVPQGGSGQDVAHPAFGHMDHFGEHRLGARGLLGLQVTLQGGLQVGIPGGEAPQPPRGRGAGMVLHPELELAPVQGGGTGGRQAGQRGEGRWKGLRLRVAEGFHIGIRQFPGRHSLPPGQLREEESVPLGKPGRRRGGLEGQVLQQGALQRGRPVEPDPAFLVQHLQQRQPARSVPLGKGRPEPLQRALRAGRGQAAQRVRPLFQSATNHRRQGQLGGRAEEVHLEDIPGIRGKAQRGHGRHQAGMPARVRPDGCLPEVFQVLAQPHQGLGPWGGARVGLQGGDHMAEGIGTGQRGWSSAPRSCAWMICSRKDRASAGGTCKCWARLIVRSSRRAPGSACCNAKSRCGVASTASRW